MEHPAYSMAAIVGIGGIGGFIRRGSVPSLAAGVGISGLYLYSGRLLQANADNGIELASAASGLLILGSLPRAIKTRKPVPIALSVLGVSALGYYGKKYADYYL